MIDFKKYVSKCDGEKTKISPIEVYNGLDRTSETGPLRESQEWILENWYKDRFDDKDLIVKMNTGEGKTLVGLLMLLTKLKHNKGKHIYLCPNLYLVDQVCKNADRFGIPYCRIEDKGEIPKEFWLGDKILITTIQKLFNGKSKFGIDNNSTPLDTILIDDAHSCVEIIKNQYTIVINRDKSSELYESIIDVFKDNLEHQAKGTYNDIIDHKSNEVMLVPYWVFIDKYEMIFNMLKDLSDDSIQFAWQLLKNNLEHCQCYISSKRIEICPDYVDIDRFGSFSNAKNRILMSASEQDQSFLIKTFQFSDYAIKNPLLNQKNKYTGEKMILFPSLLSDVFDRDMVASKFIDNKDNKYGIVALVSNTNRADYYSDLGWSILNSENINEELLNFKQKQFEKLLVIVNRYDGIDLPDESCRVLIFDSLPYSGSLSEQYEDKCRSGSSIVNKRIAQKIEQGIGRGVRGEKDYCVILINGNDLVQFVFKYKDSLFSNQIRKQFDIGNTLMDALNIDMQTPDFSSIFDLIRQVIDRDENWKIFYDENMNKIENDKEFFSFDIIKKENEFEKNIYKRDYDKAIKIIRELVDENKNNDYECGWYLQQLARSTYFNSQLDANKLQKAAYEKNIDLLKPIDGMNFKKVKVNSGQIENIKKELSKYSSYNDCYLDISKLLDDLSFGTPSDKFEDALNKIGCVLGYTCQRPDKMYNDGPDNLWNVGNGKYFIFECKNEVSESRLHIYKNEAGQSNVSNGWFKKNYGSAKLEQYMIIPTTSLEKDAYFNCEVNIIRKEKLNLLKQNIRGFILEFKDYNLNYMTNERIEECLVKYKLREIDFKNNYSEIAK